MSSLAIVILAAGKGTRLKSELVKVLHPLAGRPLLSYSLDLAQALRPDRLLVVVGYQGELIRRRFPPEGFLFVDQPEQRGTGHAVAMTAELLKDFQGTVLILLADVPLLTLPTVERFLRAHRESGAVLSVLTAFLSDPRGYGRIFRGPENRLLKIVEDKDLPPGGEAVGEINTGVYCVEAGFLFPALASLSDRNAQQEFYLPDIAERATSQGQKTLASPVADPLEIMGINSRLDLARAGQIIRQRIAEKHMLNGVSLIDPASTYIDSEVEIGRDTVVHPNCSLLGRTSLGEACLVESGCQVKDSRLGAKVTLRPYSVITETLVEDGVEIGPFAHLRPQSHLREKAKIGNFVEIKKSVIGRGSKANHLSYIGDATVGEGVNIGAGTITCNYDGRRKHPTTIEDGVFIGSNTELVAPVRIGHHALVGAGSTITKEVPPETMAVSRAKQVHYRKRTKHED
ncbi:MAG: bifunctional UDP-N-acetylglucosamine diphosphorylase/glucosamine-1-phosphate N-acetyltransferase GlmU [Deltaproteobacteria bacterium]|nr:bifunctional UDP-N-acetylglucosamine diphosphorylase/glucosamine-1-phosphate N-acetyltransferase GlmU [Deltaproteobacteria bacterium]